MKNILIFLLSFSNTAFSQKFSGDSTFGYILSSGWRDVDKNHKTVDSTWGDIWYICNYKKVPEYGLYIDEIRYPKGRDEGYVYSNYMIFYDRRLLGDFRGHIFYKSFNSELFYDIITSTKIKRIDYE